MDPAPFFQLPYWDALTEPQRRLVAENLRTLRFAKGALVLAGGDCMGLLLVTRGSLRAYLLSEEGREVTIFRVGPGECCVLSATCVMSQIHFETHMEAEEDTEFLLLGSGVFRQLTEENVSIRCFLYEMAAERFSEVLWVMQQILFMGFDHRLALFLVDACRRAGGQQLKVTHEQIARDLGSAREVVTRMLRRFSEEGLVELGRGTVTVKAPEELERLADG